MQVTNAALAGALVASALSYVSADMGASPHGYVETYPDNTQSPLTFMVGGAQDHHEEDEKGYTMIDDPYGSGYKVYAEEDTFTHELISSGCIAGKCQPENAPAQLTPHLTESAAEHERHCGDFCHKSEDEAPSRIIEKAKMESESDSSRRLSTTTMKNLVLFVRWSDHVGRATPTTSQYKDLFNKPGYSQTGSIRDVFLFNSYGKFDLDSHIYVPPGNDPEDPFIVVPYTEAYVGNGNSGLSSRGHAAYKYCLDVVESDPSINLADFDTFGGGDSWIDAITYIHTGFAAEWGGTDQDGQTHKNRIWSHKWAFSTWTSAKSGVKVSTYHISPGMWWTQGSNIGRIGVIAHETGHFLGLPDLYDGSGGAGVGSYCLMGNSWGFGGTQYHPPMMSPWAKIQLGWATPTVISASATYEIQAAKDVGQIYKIASGFPSGEYLLIENRQPHVIDKVPQGGLLIWHIDEAVGNRNEGSPAQSGWPGNGNHYKNALIQADGGFDLERNLDRGDKFDTFRAGGTHEIGPSGIVPPGPYGGYPNTDCYKSGDVQTTGHRIHDISTSGDIMTFSLNGGGTPPTTTTTTSTTTATTTTPATTTTTTPTTTTTTTTAATTTPATTTTTTTTTSTTTPATTTTTSTTTTEGPVTYIPAELTTTYAGGSGQAGNMFDVMCKKTLLIETFDVHCDDTGTHSIEVYTKPGSYRGFERVSGDWTQICSDASLKCNGKNSATSIDLSKCTPTECNGERAFYVTFSSRDMDYTRVSQSEGSVYVSNDEIDVKVGVGAKFRFGYNYRPRLWNGSIKYKVPAASPELTAGAHIEYKTDETYDDDDDEIVWDD